MTDFGAMTPTGKKTTGPTSELIELQGANGELQTAILYNTAYHQHTRLTTAVELVQSFMEFPMVTGFADMTAFRTGEGLFQFNTGSVMVLYDVLRSMRDQRKAMGVRAGVELGEAIASSLQEASENGPPQGIYSSSGLTPWRIVLDIHGMVKVIGYGLPQIDMVELRETGEGKPREDSFKYCPPERLTSGDEDISSDLFALALIVYEVITGKPLLSGTSTEMRKLVEHGAAQQLLMENPGKIPAAVHNVLVQALAFDPIGRFEEPIEFAEALQEVLENDPPKGKSLEEIMQLVGPTLQRGTRLKDASSKQAAKPVSTRSTRSTGTRRSSRGAAKEEKEQAAPEAGNRWGKASRAGASGAHARQSEEENDEKAAPSRRRRGSASEEEAPSRRSRRTRGAAEEEESASATPSRRSRRGRADDTVEEGKPTRRSRRGKATETEDEAPKEAAPKEAAPKEAAPKEAAPRRSRRGKAAEKEEEAPKEAAPRRSRRGKAAEKEEEAPKEAAPRRSRRGKAAEKEEEAPKEAAPRRSRRGKATADKDEKAAAPRRSRRAKADTEDEPVRPRRRRRTKEE